MTGRLSTTVGDSWRDVRVAGVSADVAAGVAAPAHGARGAGGVQRTRGGCSAGAAPLAHGKAAAGQAQEGAPLVRGPHRHRQRGAGALANGCAESLPATATVQVSRTS